MYSSSILSATPTSYHPSIHKAIYPISHSSKRHQSIRPSNYQTAIHPFIRRAIITSNHPYSSNLCTHRSSFQSSKHLIVHSSTKLPIQSVIRPCCISLSIHIATQAAIVYRTKRYPRFLLVFYILSKISVSVLLHKVTKLDFMKQIMISFVP